MWMHHIVGHYPNYTLPMNPTSTVCAHAALTQCHVSGVRESVYWQELVTDMHQWRALSNKTYNVYNSIQ